MAMLLLSDEISELKRKKAYYYKNIILEGVSCYENIEVSSGGNSLILKKGQAKEVEGQEEYVIITREIGLYNYGTLQTKINVMFCDNGYMLLELKYGGCLFRKGKDIINVTVGVDVSYVDMGQVVWLSADNLHSGTKYFSNFQGVHTQDFNYSFTVTGGIVDGSPVMDIKHNKNETLDISFGYITSLELEQINKQNEEDGYYTDYNKLSEEYGDVYYEDSIYYEDDEDWDGDLEEDLDYEDFY